MFFSVLCLAIIAASNGAKFTIKNTGKSQLWIGTLSNGGKSLLENGGFSLNPNQERVFYTDGKWAGRFWARTKCNWNSKHCATGDCGNKLECRGAGGVPPVTLVEILLNGAGGQDFYDISLVDGYNVPATITPQGGSGKCKPLRCQNNINRACPWQLQVKSGNEVVACQSSCTKYNTDQYCCRNAYNSASKCRPSTWQVNSAKLFKQQCPDAYSFAYDDKSSLMTCKSQSYYITFG